MFYIQKPLHTRVLRLFLIMFAIIFSFAISFRVNAMPLRQGQGKPSRLFERSNVSKMQNIAFLQRFNRFAAPARILSCGFRRKIEPTFLAPIQCFG